MKLRSLSLFVVALTLVAPTYAQDQCNAILSLGFKNVYKKLGTKSSASAKCQSYCGKTQSSFSDNMMVEAAVDVVGYGDGSAKYTRATAEAKLNEWCNQNRESATAASVDNLEAEQINKESVAAWDSCNRLNRADLVIESQISEEVVDLRVSFKGSARGGIQFYSVDATNFSCDVKVPTKDGPKTFVPGSKENIIVSSQAISVLCKRAPAVARNRTNDPTQYQVREAASISVRTAAGAPFTLPFVEEWTPDVPGRESALLRGELAKANAALSVQVKALQGEVAALKTEAATKTEVAALTTSAAAEKAALRYTFVKVGVPCPQGWTPRSVLLWEMADDPNYASSTFQPALVSRQGWKFTHPYLCERG